jgi:hypothetical protein
MKRGAIPFYQKKNLVPCLWRRVARKVQDDELDFNTTDLYPRSVNSRVWSGYSLLPDGGVKCHHVHESKPVKISVVTNVGSRTVQRSGNSFGSSSWTGCYDPIWPNTMATHPMAGDIIDRS